MGMRRTPCGYFAPRNDRNGLIDTLKSPDFVRNQDFFAFFRPLLARRFTLGCGRCMSIQTCDVCPLVKAAHLPFPRPADPFIDLSGTKCA